MVHSKNEERQGNRDLVTSMTTNSPTLTRAFLKDGETLKPVQRTGVLVISVLVLGWGAYFAADSWEAIHNSSPRSLLSCGPALVLSVMGLLGMRNALRFKAKKRHD